MTIPIQQFTFHCRWTSEARLPLYLGSTLRGAFGWALRKSSCALKNQECATCILRQRCAYAWVFETERYTDSTGGNVNARPHPFVLQPGENACGSRQSGEIWTFSLLLVGRGIDFLPHIVYSVQLMGESGIGSATRRGAGRFVLESIQSGTTRVYDGHTNVLERAGAEDLALGAPPARPVRAIRLTLHTPLRLKKDNALHRDLPFHVLVRTALRRVSALEIAYGQGEPPLDYPGLVRRSEQVATVASTLHWQELMRFSNRQRQKVSLSGLLGTADYQGDLTEFVPLLDYAGRINLGKQTVFGLGHFSCRPLTDNLSAMTAQPLPREQSSWSRPL